MNGRESCAQPAPHPQLACGLPRTAGRSLLLGAPTPSQRVPVDWIFHEALCYPVSPISEPKPLIRASKGRGTPLPSWAEPEASKLMQVTGKALIGVNEIVKGYPREGRICRRDPHLKWSKGRSKTGKRFTQLLPGSLTRDEHHPLVVHLSQPSLPAFPRRSLSAGAQGGC